MSPTLFKIGPFAIHSYGVALAIAVFLGIYIVEFKAKKNGIDSQKIYDFAFWVLITAIAGARVLFVVTHLGDYRDELWRVVAIWEGGLTFYGGLIPAVVVGILYLKKQKLNVWKVTDFTAPAIALGIGIVRIGCFLNGCCFGKPTQLGCGVRFPPGSYPYHQFPTETIHPTQLYSSLTGFLIFFVLIVLGRKRRYDGFLFSFYLISYSIFRFFIDFIRYYEESNIILKRWGIEFTINQFASLSLLVFSVFLMIRLKKV